MQKVSINNGQVNRLDQKGMEAHFNGLKELPLLLLNMCVCMCRDGPKLRQSKTREVSRFQLLTTKYNCYQCLINI